eukprot:TRINITY_DN4209_c0_g1_i3.p1 TRINITY_DN4209_c0_g1~~TRINITY_DN4209_c0_g1_i3.p1  ORF type:complete len:339 (+),score=57.46 TRINITY_DN4209_c0_g1_i3:808-1824(+)
MKVLEGGYFGQESRIVKLEKSNLNLSNSFWICDANYVHEKDWDALFNLNHDVETNIPHRTNCDWVSRVPDHLPLNKVWIPGTHDSASFPHHHVGFVDDINRTQSFTIPNQLAAGIRFLDIRLRHAKDHLYLHHGLVYLQDTWIGVLVKCLNFVKDHPSEFILIKIQQEHVPEANTVTTWGDLVKSGIQSVLPAQNFWNFPTIPTVGQSRGKIILTTWSPLLNPSYPDLGFIPWGGTSKEDEKKYIQDLYNGPSFGTKWSHILHLWAKSYQEPNPLYFFVNHATASGLIPGTKPRHYSKNIHMKLFPTLLCAPSAPQVILMDFPSVEMVETIFERNFRS